MPQAIPIIIAAAGSYVGASALALAIAQILAAAAVGMYERDKARKKAREAFTASLQDRIFTVRSGVAPRRYVVGTVRVGGVLMNADTIGANKSGFDTVIAYANNRCELVSYFVGEDNIGLTPTDEKYGKQELHDVYEEFVVNGPSATITLGGRPVDGVVHAGQHASGYKPLVCSATLAPTGSNCTITGLYNTTNITVSVTYKLETGSKLRLQFKLGTATQDSTQWDGFTSDRWTANHRLLGVCHSRALYLWDETLWSGGAQEIGAILKGGPAETPDGVFGFYDPRSGQTLTYTDNPALLWGWWRTLPRKYGGMGVPSDWIDWQSVSIAANICDELVTVKKLDGSDYESIKRYQCHTVLSTDRAASDNEQIILSAMAGKKAFTGGLYRVVAGAFRPATKTIRDSDVVGDKPISVISSDPGDLPKNVCTARFSNAHKNYAESEPRPVRNSSYITLDGGEREPLDLTLEGSTDERQVNYLMGVALETQRPAFGVTLTVRGIGEDIALLDTVTLDLTNRSTYANRTLEVVSSVDNWDGTYDLALAEIKPENFALNPDTFTPSNPPALPDLSYLWDIPAITGFTVTPVAPVLLPGSLTIAQIACSWDAPPAEGVQQGGHVEIRFKSSLGEWVAVASLPGDATSTVITSGIIDSDVYQFQIRAVSSIGATSPWADAFIQSNGIELPSGWTPVKTSAAGASMVVVSNQIQKFGGVAAWDSQVFSRESYSGGCSLTFRPLQANANFVIGLNADPATDANYTSIDYGWYCQSDGTLRFAESGSLINPSLTYDTNSSFEIRYDGVWVRYLRNGTIVREVYDVGQRFFLDSSWYTPGAAVSGAQFIPLTPTHPVAFTARGNCFVSDNSLGKQGGTTAWDSDAFSTIGYGNCHLSFKASQTTAAIMIGLNRDPTTDSTYTGIDQCFYLDDGAPGTWHIYEGGADTGISGSYTTNSVFEMTYDSTNYRFYVDKKQVRATSGPSVTLFMDSSFYSPGGGVNSLRFGPTTNLAVTDTAQLGLGAVTDVAVTVEPADGSLVYLAGTQPRIELVGIDGNASYTSPAFSSTQVKVSWSAQARISNTTSGTAVGEARIQVSVSIDGTPVWSRYMPLEGYTASGIWAQFSGSRDFSVQAGQTIDVNMKTYRSFSGSGTSPTQTIFWQGALLNLTGVKR